MPEVLQFPRDAKITLEIRRWDGARNAVWIGEELYGDLEADALASMLQGDVRRMMQDLKALPERERVV